MTLSPRLIQWERCPLIHLPWFAFTLAEVHWKKGEKNWSGPLSQSAPFTLKLCPKIHKALPLCMRRIQAVMETVAECGMTDSSPLRQGYCHFWRLVLFCTAHIHTFIHSCRNIHFILSRKQAPKKEAQKKILNSTPLNVPILPQHSAK